MKSGRLTFVALLACYLYCIGFASSLIFGFSRGRTWALWYILLIFLLGLFSGCGLVIWASSRPKVPKLVTYVLLTSLLYFVFCIAYPGA